MGEAMQLDPDFRDFVELFTANDVHFLIVGGYTGDLDASIWISAENASRIVRSLEAFGFTNLGLSEEDFNQPDRVVQLGYAPYRIDILTSIEGVEFNDAWERRVVLDLDGIEVPFIGHADLLTNTRVAGRHQDIADVERLTRQESDGL